MAILRTQSFLRILQNTTTWMAVTVNKTHGFTITQEEDNKNHKQERTQQDIVTLATHFATMGKSHQKSHETAYEGIQVEQETTDMENDYIQED